MLVGHIFKGHEICKCHGLAQSVFKEGMFFLKIPTSLHRWLPAETQLVDGDFSKFQ